MHGSFQGAEQTGGDTFELALTQRGLSTLQMHAMLRLARQLGATLATAFREVNDRLAATRRDSRFVAACVGLLDPTTRGLSMLSGGQVPILPLHAASGGCTAHRATSLQGAATAGAAAGAPGAGVLPRRRMCRPLAHLL